MEDKKIGESNKKIRGWLLFFCIIITIILPIVTMYSITNASISFIQNYGERLIVDILISIALIFSVAIVVFSIYTGIVLWNNNNPMKLVRIFLFCYLGVNVLLYLMNALAIHMFLALFNNLLVSIIFFDICFNYFKYSKRVFDTFKSDQDEKMFPKL